jgi:serine/threonine protein kinase
MLARVLPFHSSDKKKTFKLIKEADPDFTVEGFGNISDDCKDLISLMLTKDPKKRITINEALKHKWFKKYQGFITQIKKRYHPVIDEQTGLLIKPFSIRRASNIFDSKSNVLSGGGGS